MNARLDAALDADLAALAEAGTLKRFRVLLGPQAPRTTLQGSGAVVVASSNDYLGLAADPEVIAAGVDGLQRYGAGTASVRFICGTFEPHLALESDLATFLGTAAATTYVSCWDANAALLTTLADRDTVIFSDALNHASIVDACRTSRARRTVVYPHNDVAALESALVEHSDAARRLVVTDGVFSMEGGLAPLPELVDATRRHDAVLVVDDSHGLGVMGPTGRGTAEHFGLHGEIDVVTGTLGKALGGAAGGFVAGSAAVCSTLAQRARPGLFSNGLPPTVACSAREALRLLSTRPALVTRLHDVTAALRSGLAHRGVVALDSESAIIAIVVGETAAAIAMSERLEVEHRMLITGFGYPVVPEGTARLRIQASAAMDDATVAQIVDAVATVVTTTPLS